MHFLSKTSFIKAIRKCTYLLVLPVLVMACAQQPPSLVSIEDQLSMSKTGNSVILLHGLWRDSIAMQPMEDYLTTKGFKVHNISYPSDEYPIEEVVTKHLQPVVTAIEAKNKNEAIHFVSHSMGGILVRYYLKNNSVKKLGKVVMLSPPNQGSKLSDFATSLSEDWLGPSGKQLSTKDNSWVKNLGKVNFNLGVIAGNHSTNWVTSWIIKEKNDGVVAVEDTKVAGMTDFLVVPEKHFRIRKLPIAMQQTVYFLQNGTFYQQQN
jgi:pimeloyl-ACP methyl ester carboxylesterase